MKTNKYTIIHFMIIILVVFSSCKKDFLDKEPYDAVPFESAILTESDLDAAVNGVYSAMRGAAIYGRSLPIMNDIMADNVYIFEINSNMA